MAEEPQNYTPTYINQGNPRNPFSPSYGLGWQQDQAAPVYVVKQKSLLLAYVLWFFLGWLGIHKFYLRQPIMGVLYLVLFGIGSATWQFLIGFFPLGLWGLLMLLDIFTMPIRVGLMNSLATRRGY